MEFKNDFKSYDFKYKIEESLDNNYKTRTKSFDKFETRVPDDDKLSSKVSLKKYLSQIKSLRNSTDFDLSSFKTENGSNSKQNEPVVTKPSNKYERFQKLEKSLNGIQTNVELKRSTILEDIYQKINKLENKINDSELYSIKKIDTIGKRIESVEKNIDNLNKKHENVLIEKAEAIDNICEKFEIEIIKTSRFHQSLSKEHESWRTGEKNILDSVNQQINGVKEEISEMKKIKSQIISNFKVYTDVELPKFKAKIEKANSGIYTMEERIIRNTSDDLLTLANFIKEEDEKINDWKDKMGEKINIELTNLQLEIKKECDERKETQKKLITLMEETIKRLESPL